MYNGNKIILLIKIVNIKTILRVIIYAMVTKLFY